VQQLADMLSGRNEDVSLDVAALQLASIEHPELAVGPFLELLDSYAKELAERVPSATSGKSYVRRANQLLFGELGFVGNSDDYYHPRNSCLNDVLLERTGLPITLSLVYIEIGRRLNRPIYGIAMPGHFVVRYDDGDFASFIDPFHGGQLLTKEACWDLAKQVTGMDISTDPTYLQPVTKRQMLLRMLQNLRAAYLRRQAYPKLVQVLDLLIEATGQAEDYKQRGYLHLHLKQFPKARHDLEKYLLLCDPKAEDRPDVERRLKAIRDWLAQMN
jgi:regulator of sirC expression with transglutaminase-like and TPR domain